MLLVAGGSVRSRAQGSVALIRCSKRPFVALLVALMLAGAGPLAAQQAGGPFSGPAPAPPPLTGASLQVPGVPQGVLTGPLTLRSSVYDGMVSHYWVYAPAQYDSKVPAALMVFQDGEGYLNRGGDHPALNVLDNLIAENKIPVMVAVFINPGEIAGSPGTPTYEAVTRMQKELNCPFEFCMRSVEYDSVSDRYARFLRDELLPSVYSRYNIRADAYSHAITGLSSGGICAFNAAWQRPDLFSRVISWIGSFTGIQWREDPANVDGGQDYPDKVLRETHRNLRVWLQDGSNDQENPVHGSWPLANLRMANALKLQRYDFHFSFGGGPHTVNEGAAEFPAEMIWLWRGFDPAKTSETFTQEPEEVSRPPFRVGIVNR